MRPRLRSFGVYKLDVNQGNFLSQDMVDKLRVGQTKQQVRLILGTPLIASVFRDDRWDYIVRVHRGRAASSSIATSPSISPTTSSRAGKATRCRHRPPSSIARRPRLTSNEAKWSNQRSWWDSILDIFRQ